ncbi:ABC transporter substrate-binding protein [Acidisphaera rubrifaciens]|uniref:ABC transporter substrate-binding protein n=1 Tax=Acidisphaera rubrifaciens TaxID=50715 RepID=UPI00130EA3E6|nr:ABC transporter substrate-binding protein [Acidisphaera rubrifaciens]
MRRLVLAVIALLVAGRVAGAAEITDATGRTVQVPDHPARVLPAGYPASVLLAALAPDLMIGWTHPPSAAAAAFLPPALAKLPSVARVTFEGAGAAVKTYHPDLVLDYGDATPRYARAAADIQRQTGIPTILLDGHLTAAPAALRLAGQAVGRPARGEMLARLAEDLLAAVPKPARAMRVAILRGGDPPAVAQPGSLATEVVTLLGWTPVAPPSAKGGMFRPASIADIAALNPDLILIHGMDARAAMAKSAAWQAVPAVRDGHVLVEPEVPFGWIEEPPSINRLLGLAWLSGRSGADGGAGAATGTALSALLFDHLPPPQSVTDLRTFLEERGR